MPLVFDCDSETLCVGRICVKQGLPEVLGKVLGKVLGRVQKGRWSGETAHVDAPLHVSDMDEVARCTVANVGVHGEGTA